MWFSHVRPVCAFDVNLQALCIKEGSRLNLYELDSCTPLAIRTCSPRCLLRWPGEASSGAPTQRPNSGGSTSTLEVSKGGSWGGNPQWSQELQPLKAPGPITEPEAEAEPSRQVAKGSVGSPGMTVLPPRFSSWKRAVFTKGKAPCYPKWVVSYLVNNMALEMG